MCVCRGVTVHKIHRSVRYSGFTVRYVLIQQKERNAREISLIFTNYLLKLYIFFTLNNDGAGLQTATKTVAFVTKKY